MISILYVDDERDLLEVAQVILEESGEFSVKTATSAKEALASPSISEYDAIISDYLMPGMDGIAFLKAVRERYGDIPFILFTGKGREDVVIEAINSGADFYLQKGGDPEAQFAELAHKIRQAVRSRRSERELRINEERLRMAQAIGHTGSWEYSLATNTIWGSAEGLRMFGFPPHAGNFPIEDIEACIQERERVHQALVDLIASGKEYNLEYTIHPADGSAPKVIHSIARLDKDPAGKPLKVIGSIQDITPRKATEDAMRESEKKFRTIFENSPYPIAINSITDYKFLEINKAFLDASGYTEEEIIGTDPVGLGLLPLTEAAKLISRRVLAGKIENVPLALTVKEGRRVHVLFSTMPITINNKPAIVTVTTEITKLKRIEEDLLRKNEDLNAAFEQLAASDEELRQNYDELSKKEGVLRASEEKFRALVEYSLDGIVIADFAGTLLFANRAASIIVDEPDYQSMVGKKNVMEYVTPESQADVLRDFRKVSQGIDAYLVHYKLITGKGREVWVECIGKKIPFGDTEAMLVSMRDVTERTLAEERLKESEKKFSTVFRSSPVALTLVSATDGTIVDVNEAFLRNTGYARHEVVGNMAVALGIFADRAEYKRFNSDLRNHRTVYGREMKCRIKTGEIRTCRFSSGVVLMDGKPHILSTVEDITERKKTEEALRESEQKFRRLADSAPDMIFRMSIPDRKYEYVSPASVALTGYSPEEFYADPAIIRSLIHPAWKEYFQRQWEDLLEKNVPPVYEYQIIDRSGQTRWFHQRNMLITDEYGRAVAIEGIVTDTTVQKNTEHELRRNELRSLAVSENVGDWIWEIDRDGMYRYSSPAVVHILGYQPDELVGKMYFYDLFDPSVKESLTTTVFGSMENREPFRNFENLNRHKNGKPVLLMTSGTPVFDEEGTFTGYCGVDEDITERKARDSAFQAIVRSMVGTTGMDALRQIAENISSWLSTDCVMIGEIQPDHQTVKVLFMLLDGKEVSGFKYTLTGTPCENVAEKGFCLYEDNVKQLFPASRDLFELNIRGYLGTPLRNSAGQVFGILCALSRAPLRPTPSMQEIMEIIAVKAAAEMEGMQMDRALRESEQKFRSLVEYALEGILISDLQGTILFANNAMARTVESEDSAGLIGRNVMEFVAPESQNDVIRDFGEVAKGHDAYIAQYKVITDKGNEIYIESIGKVISYEGKPADLVSIHDVTERKRAEDALSGSQRQLAEAMDMAHLVNWEFDIASGMFTFDDRFYALYGTTSEREGGNLMPAEVYAREFVHPDDMHMMGEEVARAVAATDPDYTGRVEHRIIRRDGEVRHIVVRIRITMDKEGRPIKTHGANQDITEIKLAEEAVRESEARYRLLAENVHDVIFTATMDMRLTYISPSVMALRGLTAEEAMAGSLADALTPASLELMMKARELGLESMKQGASLPSSTMELEFYRKDGSTVWTETIITLAWDSNKRPAGVVGVMRDLTQRKQVENALLESEEKFRALVETSPGVIWEIDTLGRFQYISPMVKEILGYEPDELIGMSFKDLVLESLKPLLMQTLAMMASSSSGSLLPFEVIAHHRDGHDMVLEIRPSRVTGIDGKVTGFRGVAYDTTTRKKAEEELKRANRQLTLLSSITRHDLLNKITVILGNLKIAERKCTEPAQGEYLHKIRNATSAIKSQIEFTRVYQNLGTTEPQWIDLDSVMPRPYVPSTVTLDAAVQDIQVRADPMLERVFFNLIDNSVRHGERVTEIRVSSHQSGEDLVVVWEDNGTGIPADEKEQIFERGFGENTGLGMFLAREILALTCITIRETGEPGRGARFEITVPKGAYRIAAENNPDPDQPE